MLYMEMKNTENHNLAYIISSCLFLKLNYIYKMKQTVGLEEHAFMYRLFRLCLCLQSNKQAIKIRHGGNVKTREMHAGPALMYFFSVSLRTEMLNEQKQ